MHATWLSWRAFPEYLHKLHLPSLNEVCFCFWSEKKNTSTLLALKPQIIKEQLESLLLEVSFPARAACLCS